MIEKLQAIVSATHVKTDIESWANWACAATRQYVPAATANAFPASTKEVQAIVKPTNLKNRLGAIGGSVALANFGGPIR